MINTWSKKWWFCLEESSLSLGSLRNKQTAVLPAFCLHECFHAVVHSWVLACFLRTACIVWGLASWSPTLMDTPSFQSSLVKQRPINRPLAIFHLTKLWFTCQWLHWWCLCTGHHSASTALLMVSALLSLPHQQKHMGTFMFHKAQRTREEENRL